MDIQRVEVLSAAIIKDFKKARDNKLIKAMEENMDMDYEAIKAEKDKQRKYQEDALKKNAEQYQKNKFLIDNELSDIVEKAANNFNQKPSNFKAIKFASWPRIILSIHRKMALDVDKTAPLNIEEIKECPSVVAFIDFTLSNDGNIETGIRVFNEKIPKIEPKTTKNNNEIKDFVAENMRFFIAEVHKCVL